MGTFSQQKALHEAYVAAARAAGHRYADLLTAAAAKAIRDYHPTAARVVFALNQDSDGGWGANLVFVYDTAGYLLWDEDREQDGDVGGDSLITDPLATAQAWGHDYFPRHRGGDDLYVLEIGRYHS